MGKLFLVITIVLAAALLSLIFKGQNNIISHGPDYTPQRMVVDDALIDEGSSHAVIQPLWWSCDIYKSPEAYHESLKPFSHEQCHVFAVEWYLSEVYNGGHHQFFYNGTGIVWKEALEGLKAMGAGEAEAILTEAVMLLGGNPSLHREERWNQLDQASEEALDALDTRLYDMPEDINSKLMAYITANRKQCYFDGTVLKP